MKKCPYCGTEYSDEVLICPTDRETLVGEASKAPTAPPPIPFWERWYEASNKRLEQQLAAAPIRKCSCAASLRPISASSGFAYKLMLVPLIGPVAGAAKVKPIIQYQCESCGMSMKFVGGDVLTTALFCFLIYGIILIFLGLDALQSHKLSDYGWVLLLSTVIVGYGCYIFVTGVKNRLRYPKAQ